MKVLQLEEDTIRIHLHNINNIPLCTTKNRGIVNELKQQVADTYLLQKTCIYWFKMPKYDSSQSRTKGLGLLLNLAYNTTELN